MNNFETMIYVNKKHGVQNKDRKVRTNYCLGFCNMNRSFPGMTFQSEGTAFLKAK
jgi:hypothetical protein